MLDLLPEHVWTDLNLRWLDPGCKTGVFLREVVKRLLVGLEPSIPDEQERLNHILKEMVYGIAITELTSLVSRRTLYCSKDASSEHSVVGMDSPEGNIWFRRSNHNFISGRCRQCGASESAMEHADGRENHAYAFIHDDAREEVWKELGMKFDVIVGNPPYHMSGGGGGSNDTPLYHFFVDQAKALNPSYLTMVTPSRWMAGGRGLEDFRERTLSDERISHIVDYPNSTEVFPNQDIKGGISYFLWEREHAGECQMTLVRDGEEIGPTSRKLDEFDVFVRDKRALDILHKIRAVGEATMERVISSDTPFGLATNFKGFSDHPVDGYVLLHYVSKGKRREGWLPSSAISKNTHLIEAWKVLLPEAGSDGGQRLPDSVLGQPMVAAPWSCCTQTYLVAGPFLNKEESASVLSYVQTKFFRFLVSLRKISQHALRSTYQWVPQQSWDRIWTDEALYEKYGITEGEQAYIASMVKEMPT